MSVMNRPSFHHRRWWLVAIVPLFACAAARAGAQDVGPDKPDTPFNHGTFRFAAQARVALHGLWVMSIRANEERVACLGGQVDGDVVYITRISVLEPGRADSANISAIASLQQCAPPEWLGTVHTHIVKLAGQPYIAFSGPDRVVMTMWRQRWKQLGVFCILYSESEANCEAGYGLSSIAAYGYGRGNNILF
jgi:hypothetical protein